jgi:hypothetical protein
MKEELTKKDQTCQALAGERDDARAAIGKLQQQVCVGV